MKWQHSPTPEKKDGLAGSRLTPFKSIHFPFLTIMAFAIICTSFAVYQIQRRSLEESLFSQAEVRTHNTRDIIQKFLAKRLDSLLNHSRNLTGRDTIRQEMLRLLADPHQTSSINALNQQLNHIDYDFGLSNVSLLDKRGQLIFTHGRKARFNQSDIDVVIALKGHEYSDIAQDGKTWLLRAAIPLQAKNNTIGALILAEELNLHLNEFAETNQIELVLADKNGIQAKGNISAESIAIDQKKIEQVLDQGEMQSIINLQRNRLAHYMQIQVGSHRFVLISQIGLGPILQILQQKKQEVLQSTLIILAILLPLSSWFVHMLLRPLIVLRERAAGVAEKLAGISLEEYRGHEITRLVYAFDGMASALEEHEEARQKAEALLQQEHVTLEVKVKDRTQELEKANDLLLHEISERTRTQQKAEELQKFMTSLIDAMPSLLIGIDHNGRINQWNLEAQKVCGLTFSEANGRPILESLPWLKSIKEKIDQALSKGVQNKISHFPWSTNNGERLVDIMINPLSSEQYGGAVIRIDDVTERIRLDELIMQTEKMMSVGGLAAGMAHEINNPLASIIQNAQVISQRISPDLNKNRSCAEALGVNLETLNSYLNERQIPKMLTSILESGQRAGEIVKTMQTFTRGNESIRSAQDIPELLDCAVDLTTKDYDLKKNHNILQVKVNRNYADNLPKIHCNSSQLEQVFFNLIQNADQAMSSWTGMNNPPQIDLKVKQRDQMLSVEICDNGPGIDIEHQKRIFEPFFTTKEVGLGTGLGLSVSYFIITENHQGQLSVDSGKGKGTCFRILLPLHAPCEAEIKRAQINPL